MKSPIEFIKENDPELLELLYKALLSIRVVRLIEDYALYVADEMTDKNIYYVCIKEWKHWGGTTHKAGDVIPRSIYMLSGAKDCFVELNYLYPKI